MPQLRLRRFSRGGGTGLEGVLVCTVSREKAWSCLNSETECENGRFQTASAEVVQKRVEWLQRRRKRQALP
nr:MAG TPA: hypothetical protein [Caudoviricetes sp.]